MGLFHVCPSTAFGTIMAPDPVTFLVVGLHFTASASN